MLTGCASKIIITKQVGNTSRVTKKTNKNRLTSYEYNKLWGKEKNASFLLLRI